ncbi:glycosyltransferase [Cohnella pontilimi]|uniref:Glycosyltransferase n=1 Tax=Cohnella pontilimi TaxID=2564100 RepID=A0A4U0FA15_9BACL|nr:glycosyltransferase family 2 protein [Cohnella pontilimi]TJY40964.1 glycosyltransferase [Cohnella pontilimi]
MLNKILFVVQIIVGAIGVYQFVLSIFGWKAKKTAGFRDPEKTFAVLIAAHNEEKVVGALIENLLKMNYPRELFDIFVICDNCTDGTASVVRRYDGVFACERFNKHQRGKGFAIEWMLKELWSRKRQYDGIVMLDADNLVDPDFLHHMNNSLCEGHKVVQGYLDTKNPEDSWITAAYGITYWFCNRLWQLPRTRLKMANFLGGTGMCFDTALLKEMGWGATSLVEDLEFTVRCVQRGIYPVMNYDAKVYDEKPLTFRASARQRLRWMQGHFSVARRYFFPLLWQSLKERNLAKFDTALYTITVYNVLIGSILTLVLWFDQAAPGAPMFTSIYYYLPVWVTAASLFVSCAQFPFAMMLEKVKSWKVYAYLLMFPVFLLSWWPITIYAFFTQNNKTWSHTQHTRVLRLEEVQGKQM